MRGYEPLRIIQHEVRVSRLEQREIKPRYSIPSGELSLRVQIRDPIYRGLLCGEAKKG